MSDSEQTEHVRSPGEAPTLEALPPARSPQPDTLPSRQPSVSSGTRERLQALPSPGQVLTGRYTVLEPLGQGGMGVVLAAYDSRLDRRVALKLLHSAGGSSGDSGADANTRLLREAQAMARLNHPHVVHVYDAGALEDGRIFLAMEYVEGQTLRLWYRERPRPWRELLAAWLEAGRGLAAAHAAGLVHRDFKPDNVLVGRDGRLRVTDFGVARAESLPTTPPPSQVSLPANSEAWEAQLTLPGVVVGTPKYMAPELLNGQPADARSDLFAYCVSLYEALYAQPAFVGSTLHERMQAQREGRLNPPPATTQVPAWVTRAVLRGLQADPRQRPGSMQELMAALEDDPEVRRRARLRTAAMTSGVVVLAGLAAWGWGRQQQAQPCARVEQRLAGIWDTAVQARVREAFAATGLTYAPDTAARVTSALEGYAGTWVRLRTEACEAVQGQAAQPQSLAVLQEYCLERRRGELRALTELLSRGPDKELVPKAVQAVQSLPPLEDCADAKVLTAAVPPADDPTVRARAEALQEQVDRLGALYEAGKYKEGLALTEGLLKEVEALGYAPLRAQALYQAGRLQDGAGDYKAAEAWAREAIAQAARGKDDLLEARAWNQLLKVVGRRQARHAEALGLELPVQSAVDRADDDVERAQALHHLGGVQEDMGHYEEARALLERSLALQREALGPEHPGLAGSLNTLAHVLADAGQYEQARAYYEQALALKQAALGPEHPEVAAGLSSLGLLLLDMGLPEQAREALERSLAIREKALGPEHPEVAGSLTNLGMVLLELGEAGKALEHFERSLALDEKALGPEHPYAGDSLSNVAIALEDMGRYGQAREYVERSLAVRLKALEPDHPDVANAYNNLGSVLRKLGQYAQARAHIERALASREKVLGREHPYVAGALGDLGLVLLDMGQPEQARVRLEAAAAVYAKGKADKDSNVTGASAALGRVLVRLGRLEEAQRNLEQARASWEPDSKAPHPRAAEALLGLGELHLARHQPAQAVPLLERALGFAQPHTRVEVQQVLARALWDSRQDRARARELAAQALAYYQRLGHKPGAAAVSKWLAAHARP
jgi:eukaryotic-like serine/threonine-protein kinase